MDWKLHNAEAVLKDRLFDLIDDVMAARSGRDVWNVYLNEARKVGLTHGKACFVTAEPETFTHMFASAMPSGWIERYCAEGLGAGDLLAGLARRRNRPFLWTLSDWKADELEPAAQKWRDHNQQFDICSGLCIPDYRDGDHMFLVLCGDGRPLHPHDVQALAYAGQEVLLRFHELGLSAPPSHGLSAREMECLRWAAEGKTDWEIGQILALSAKTVNVYIERAKTKLNANTRAQAVAAAHQMIRAARG